ncbi:hypothetical protein [Duganella phyllosphaerae]|uniref:Porin domain-containing protein n=1 Tax=Duganella phyllosphaerae TaxID=762836 RepID=A0A1E7WUU6_9BURK|nr:hypothetical protein [Duganella phyllosphaerae]OFA03473.1 hypothetical protein DUPY_18550 [Duganella phyllosphaerae]
MQSNISFDFGGGTVLNVPQSSTAVGVGYDPGAWFVQAEYTGVKLPGITPSGWGAYVIGGYRIGNFTPYLIHAKSWTANVRGLSTFDQRTTSLGLRWDAMKNIAVKMQVDQIKPDSDSNGYFINVRPGLSGSNVRLVSLAVDFVF